MLLLVKVKIPVIKERKESRSLSVPPLIVIILLLVSSVIGVFYFHADYNPVDVSGKYDRDWFEEHNRATIPPDLDELLNNLSDLIQNSDLSQEYPELNDPDQLLSGMLPNTTDFYVYGSVEPLVWKIAGLDVYIDGQGWRFSGPDLIDYSPGPTPSYDVMYTVLKKDVEVNDTNRLFIPTLNAGPVGVYYTYPTTEDATPLHGGTVSVSYSTFQDDNSGGAALSLRVNVPARISFSYSLTGIFTPKEYVRTHSAGVVDTINLASTHEDLAKFTEVPPGYFDKYTQVRDLANSLYPQDFESVFDYVGRVAKFLATHFSVTDEMAPQGADPVAWFVSNGGGAILYFLYTEALILRYYGVPARIGFGYLDGRYNSTIDMTEFIPAQHIFLWLEVYDPGLGFWVNYNVFPNLMMYLPPSLRPRNLVDVSLAPIIRVFAPRAIDGYPSVYLNETFQIIVYIPGITNPDDAGHLFVFDENISMYDPIGVVPFTAYEGGVIAVYEATYEDIYGSIGESPLYGLHSIRLEFSGQAYWVSIALLKRVSIGP